jgi:hypothetical protein
MTYSKTKNNIEKQRQKKKDKKKRNRQRQKGGPTGWYNDVVGGSISPVPAR